MIQKGIIAQVIDKYTYKIRIPKYDKIESATSSTKVDDLSSGIVCAMPGIDVTYVLGDIVLVSFENDELSKPIILGLLYREQKSDSDISLSNVDNSLSDIQNNLNKINSSNLYTHIKYSNDNGITFTSLFSKSNHETIIDGEVICQPLYDDTEVNGIKIDKATRVISWSIIDSNNADVTDEIGIEITVFDSNDNIIKKERNIDHQRSFTINNSSKITGDLYFTYKLFITKEYLDTLSVMITTDKAPFGVPTGEYVGVYVSNNSRASINPSDYSWFQSSDGGDINTEINNKIARLSAEFDVKLNNLKEELDENFVIIYYKEVEWTQAEVDVYCQTGYEGTWSRDFVHGYTDEVKAGNLLYITVHNTGSTSSTEDDSYGRLEIRATEDAASGVAVQGIVTSYLVSGEVGIDALARFKSSLLEDGNETLIYGGHIETGTIATRHIQGTVIDAINNSTETSGGTALTIAADKVNIEGALIFTSGRLSQTSLDNAYDANGSATTEVTKYITKNGNTSITVHPETWQNQASYMVLTNTGLNIYNANNEPIAQYGSNIVIGQNSSNKSRTVISSDGMRIYRNDSGTDTQIAHLGYGEGNAESGTATAPYYTLGEFRTYHIDNYSSSSTYAKGDLCSYGGNTYVCRFAITTPEAWNANHWDKSIGNYSTIEGTQLIASGYSSHAEGRYACATGDFSHAEGGPIGSPVPGPRAIGMCSHAEGGSFVFARGACAHAEGYNTEANGSDAHAQNEGTIANGDEQTALGRYNVADTTSAVIIGNGTAYNARSNALTIDWNGDVNLTGQAKTSFKSSVAMGSYKSDATTVSDFVNEVRFSSGCAGSVSIGTAYTKDGVTIKKGWYNFLYMPHRSGGVNGSASGDNCNNGNLLLSGMTNNNGRFIIRIASASIAEVSKVMTSLEEKDYIIEQDTNSNGRYRKWSSGLIEAWGSYTAAANTGYASCTLPVSFTSASTFSVMATVASASNYPSLSVSPSNSGVNTVTAYVRSSANTIPTSATTVNLYCWGT